MEQHSSILGQYSKVHRSNEHFFCVCQLCANSAEQGHTQQYIAIKERCRRVINQCSSALKKTHLNSFAWHIHKKSRLLKFEASFRFSVVWTIDIHLSMGISCARSQT